MQDDQFWPDIVVFNNVKYMVSTEPEVILPGCDPGPEYLMKFISNGALQSNPSEKVSIEWLVKKVYQDALHLHNKINYLKTQIQLNKTKSSDESKLLESYKKELSNLQVNPYDDEVSEMCIWDYPYAIRKVSK